MNHNLMPVAIAIAADPFLKSPYNPVNMSRTATKKTTGHTPSLRILERVRDAADDLAQLAVTQQGWKFVTEKNDTMVYEMNGRALPPTVSTTHTFGAGGGHVSDFYLVRGVTTIHADIATVLDHLSAHTTEEFAPKMKQIFGKYYNHGVVIDELSCTTPPPFGPDPDSASGARKSFSEDDAYSVNWLSMFAPTSLGGIDKNRDFTMVCYQDAFERHDKQQLVRVGKGALQDDERRRLAQSHNAATNATTGSSSNATKMMMGVHVFTSVNFKDIPALPRSSHSDRQHFRNSGFVIEATNDPRKFRLSLFLSLLPTKASLKHARKYQKWLLSVVSCVGNLAKVVAKPELPTLSQLGKTAWKKSDHCYICLKMFRTFRRCHHCRLCGEAVCSNCSGFVKISRGSSSNRARRNSNSSVDMRSQYSYDDGFSSSDEGGSGHHNETRGCTVCIQNVASTSMSVLSRKSSMSSSSFSSNSQVTTGVGSNSVVSASLSRSEDDSTISFGDDSDFQSSIVNHGASFQAYYNNRKRSTGAMTSSSDDAQSVASMPLKANDNYHHNMLNNPSMSTTSSSFSRTSHEGDQQLSYPMLHSSSSNSDFYAQQQQQQQRSYGAPSFSSEISFGGDDLSMDPDILALAGLTLKDKSSNSSHQSHVQSVEEEEDYDDFDLSASQRGTAATTVTSGWSAGDSMNSNSSSSRGGGSTFHFSAMSSASSSVSSSSAATGLTQQQPQTSSVHAEIAALMLQDLATNTSSSSSNLSSSRGPPPQAAATVPGGRPPMSSSMRSTGQFVDRFPVASALSSSMVSSSSSSTSGGGFAPNGSAVASSSMNRNLYSSSNAAYGSSSSKIISASALASQQLASHANSERQNDMILLSLLPPKSPEFVEFSDTRRESIFVRPDDGNDMIPLDF